MIIGIGTDLLDINRLESAIQKNPRFLLRNFTENERILFAKRNGNPSVRATNFALKEAVSKALGTGFRGFNFIDIEVLRDASGKPVINLYKGALERYVALNGVTIHATASHERLFVMAYCIIEGE